MFVVSFVRGCLAYGLLLIVLLICYFRYVMSLFACCLLCGLWLAVWAFAVCLLLRLLLLVCLSLFKAFAGMVGFGWGGFVVIGLG